MKIKKNKAALIWKFSFTGIKLQIDWESEMFLLHYLCKYYNLVGVLELQKYSEQTWKQI